LPGVISNKKIDRSMLVKEKILDVRDMECENRCPLVSETFKALEPGESFVLVNKFDPKPLRNKLAMESSHGVSWEYLELGPQICRIRIGKTGQAEL